MVAWNDPPRLGCLSYNTGEHDWQWVAADQANTHKWGLRIRFGRRMMMRCARCGRAPSDPWAQPTPHLGVTR